jgi:hypothetical protein
MQGLIDTFRDIDAVFAEQRVPRRVVEMLSQLATRN